MNMISDIVNSHALTDGEIMVLSAGIGIIFAALIYLIIKFWWCKR